jgi:predicted nucleotidyltransferase
MIGKNNISFGDFLMIRENLKGLNGYGRKAEVALKACSRILDAGLDGLDAILLFGSVARGEDDRRSDVDLLPLRIR